MNFTPEPGNSIYEDFENQLAQVISLTVNSGRPVKLDLGGVDIFQAASALDAAADLVKDRLQDFIECDELELEEEDDE